MMTSYENEFDHMNTLFLYISNFGYVANVVAMFSYANI